MTERPIIFSGPMIAALLSDLKTQTRRIIQPQPRLEAVNLGHKWDKVWAYDPGPKYDYLIPVGNREMLDFCPYGQPGDRLWVRETFAPLYCNHEDEEPEFAYRADRQPSDSAYERIAWIPSIHMPRWASRLTLEICSIRVERLHEITTRDIEQEGVRFNGGNPHAFRSENMRIMFRDIWDEINSPRGFPFSSNPWVWVIEFRRIE